MGVYVNAENLRGKDSVSSAKFVKVKNAKSNYKEYTTIELLTKAKQLAKSKDSKKASELLSLYIKKTNNVDVINSDSFSLISDSSYLMKLKNKYNPKLNFFIIYFFGIGIIGLVISLVVNFRKKGDVISNVLIGTFLFLHSLFIINLCFFLSNYIYKFPELLPFSLCFSFLYGPLIYFYFKRNFEEYRFKIEDLLHLLPTLLLVSYLFSIISLDPQSKLHILINRKELFLKDLTVIIAIKCVSLMVYSYLIYKLYRQNKENKSKYFEITKWRRNLAFLIITYSVVYFFYGLSLVFQFSYTFLYPQSLILSGIVLYIGGVAYIQPKVFSKKYIFDKKVLKIKYEKSGLTEGFSEDLKQQLLILLDTEKIYRNNKLTLEELSVNLGTTRHNVSQVINEHFGINFFHLINKYRINEAISIIKSDYNRNLKIIEIAYDVGFNNKVTFNKAFKAETSLTPSQYIEELGNNLGIA